MNKILSTILLLTILAITCIFLCCKNTQKNEEIVFWTLQMSDFSPYINEVITNFEKENPKIKIKWIDVPFSEGEKRTLASVLSDNPPDLVNLNPDFSATLAHKGTLYEIPEEKTSQFNKTILNSLKVNDKLYSIPWYATSAITIYNKELLKKASVEIPKTYDSMVELAPSVKNKTNSYITLPNVTENDSMLKILNKYGIATSKDINSQKAIQVFELFKKLYTKNLIPKETVTITLSEALEKYMSGEIVMLGAGANFLNMIKENAPLIYSKTDVAPQIVGELGQNDFSLMNFVIPIRAKHKDEALEFALYLTNTENQLKLAKLTNILATNQKALQDNFYTQYKDKDLMSKARVISAKQLNSIEPAYHTQKGQKDINNIIIQATQEILLNKDSIKNILDKTQVKWKTIEE